MILVRLKSWWQYGLIVSALAAGAVVSANGNPPESAANQFMHQADFDQLAARFEDPARA